MKVTVIGAGVAGLACAVELAERGCEVEVAERGRHLGDGACAWMAGGMLAPDCEAEEAGAQVRRWGAAALDWWPARVGDAARRDGTLVVAPARDEGEIDRFARRTQDHEWVDPAAAEPALAGRFRRGLLFAREGHVDPRRALPALARRLEALGGTIRFDTAITPDEAPGDHVVDCRGMGAHAPHLRGVRGEMIMIRSREVAFSRPVRLLHPRIPLYVIPRGDGRYLIGATTIESRDTAGISLRSAVELLNGAYALHPALAEAEILETGAGLRPAFPDNLPRLETRGRVTRLNGLYRHGFLLAPAFAMQAAERITAEASS